MRSSFCFILLLVASLAVEAREPVHVALGGWSTHLKSETVTNETHNIVAAEHRGYGFGYFKNSFGRDSFFVSKNWRWDVHRNVEVTASLGINRGYRGCYGDFKESASVCLHGHLGIGYTKYFIEPTIKLFGDAIVFSPEIRF